MHRNNTEVEAERDRKCNDDLLRFIHYVQSQLPQLADLLFELSFADRPVDQADYQSNSPRSSRADGADSRRAVERTGVKGGAEYHLVGRCLCCQQITRRDLQSGYCGHALLDSRHRETVGRCTNSMSPYTLMRDERSITSRQPACTDAIRIKLENVGRIA